MTVSVFPIYIFQRTVGWTSDAYRTQNWSFEVVIGLVEWYRISRRRVCVAFRLETKMLCCQTPSWKKKAVMFTVVPNAVFSKVCEIFKVCGIESLKYVVQILHSGLLLWQHFHAHKHDTAQNETWLIASQSHGLLGRPWPFKAAKVPRPSVISLKVWLRETNWSSTYFCLTVCLRHQSAC